MDSVTGRVRELKEPDLLYAMCLVAHACSRFLRVSDLGRHNMAWQVESLAADSPSNMGLQSAALRQRAFVPLVLVDAGRWTTSTSPRKEQHKGPAQAL